MPHMFTIVLADDDNDEHEFFKEAIQSLKDKDTIRFLGFTDGEKLIKWIQKVKLLPSVIFLDINMPYLNGFDTLLLLKKIEAYKSTPVIIYSTSNNPQDIQKAYSYGANLYMCKLMSIKDLPVKLELIVDSIKNNVPLQIKDFTITTF